MAFDNEELNKRREERKQEKQLYNSQMRLLKIGAVATAVVMVFCLVAILIAQGVINAPKPPENNQAEMDATGSVPTPETGAPTEPVKDQVIHFVAGGNINITDDLVNSGATVSGYDYGNVFLDISALLSGGDLTAVNFEGNIYGNVYGTETVSAPAQMMTALRNAGIDLVQTANSFTNYNGILGLRSTLDSIRSAGMEPVGSYADSADFEKSRGFVIREVNGIRIAIVAFTKGMNGKGLPANSEDCVNLLYTDYATTYQNVDKEGISAILQDIALEKPDVTIALLHWGSRESDKISKTQEQIRDLLLAGGVDAIIGTHPYYVQKVDFDAKWGTVVAYSLGDLLSDGKKGSTKYSILLDLEITKSSQTGTVKITGVDYVPVYHVMEAGNHRLLRIREAIYAYENNFLNKVSQETYEAMKYALERVEARVNGK